MVTMCSVGREAYWWYISKKDGRKEKDEKLL